MWGRAVGRHAKVLGTAFACTALASTGGCGARTGLLDWGPLDAAADVDAGDAGPPCTGLCTQVVQCNDASATTLSGTAFVPNGTDPLYNAVVYVPNGPVEPFPMGAACNACGAPVTGDPLVSVRTGVDGSFVLSHVPSGANIPVVLQVGKWRRQFVVPEVLPCTDNRVDPSLSRLPRDHTEGDIPLMALVTGEADALECALMDYGVSSAEFTGPAYGGRVQVYVDNGATIDSPGDPGDLATILPTYDAVFYDCDGATPDGPSMNQQPIIDYANAGGWVYTSHFGYGILENPPFASTMTLAMPTLDGNYANAQGIVATGGGLAHVFTTWLNEVHALSPGGTLDIQLPKQDLLSTVPPSSAWITTNRKSPVSATTQLYTFTTPVGAPPDQACGGVVYASYHVDGPLYPAFPPPFPGSCDGLPVLPQERAYEFFVFDLPTCAP